MLWWILMKVIFYRFRYNDFFFQILTLTFCVVLAWKLKTSVRAKSTSKTKNSEKKIKKNIFSEFKTTHFYFDCWHRRSTSTGRKMQFVDSQHPSTLSTSIFTAFFITPNIYTISISYIRFNPPVSKAHCGLWVVFISQISYYNIIILLFSQN